ncbi:hypothetical protein A2U01_0116380, partial [Trifolium medium]|nr:hypothetical protein [Trifolium medium]
LGGLNGAAFGGAFGADFGGALVQTLVPLVHSSQFCFS